MVEVMKRFSEFLQIQVKEKPDGTVVVSSSLFVISFRRNTRNNFSRRKDLREGICYSHPSSGACSKYCTVLT